MDMQYMLLDLAFYGTLWFSNVRESDFEEYINDSLLAWLAFNEYERKENRRLLENDVVGIMEHVALEFYPDGKIKWK